jgi:hypothetical protein
MRQQPSEKVRLKQEKSYIILQREGELESDIRIVKQRLKEARTLEATLALRALTEKLEHERRILK